MKLVGMLPVRNEAWCLGLSLRVALLWCDEVVVLLHACTDRSAEIVWEIMRQEGNGRVWVNTAIGDWDEMFHRQCMLQDARTVGATYLAIIDADEVLDGNMATMCSTGRFKDIVYGTPPGHILQLPGYNLRNPYSLLDLKTSPENKYGLTHYHNNGIWGNRWFSVAFADDPALSWSGDRFHHREPVGKTLIPYRPIQQGQGGIIHLWGASERRLRAKHALYKITEHLRSMRAIHAIDREYSWAIHGDLQSNSFGTPDTWTYNTVPESWWAPYSHLMKYLDVYAEPWQEQEVRRLVAEHGREKFQGLDLFGVA